MTYPELEQKAVEYTDSVEEKKHWSNENDSNATFTREEVEQAYIDGAKENGIQWHEIFLGSRTNPCEYWDLPQDNLPKNENFYFVKLKNGYIKICELKYDHWSRKKYFYDLHGGKQSNVAEWLDYPTLGVEL